MNQKCQMFLKNRTGGSICYFLANTTLIKLGFARQDFDLVVCKGMSCNNHILTSLLLICFKLIEIFNNLIQVTYNLKLI